MAGELSASLTTAIAPVARQLVRAFGSTCRVRRPTPVRQANRTTVDEWAEAPGAVVLLEAIGVAHMRRVYGAESLATREGLVARSADVRIDDVLLVQRGPFAGEQLRVVGFGEEQPVADLRPLGLVSHAGPVGL